MELYHNPKCSKSRAALALLQEHEIKPVIRHYLDDSPSISELSALCLKLNLTASDIIRHKDLDKFESSITGLSDDDILALISKTPDLMVRPIAIKGTKAVIGIPPVSVLTII